MEDEIEILRIGHSNMDLDDPGVPVLLKFHSITLLFSEIKQVELRHVRDIEENDSWKVIVKTSQTSYHGRKYESESEAAIIKDKIDEEWRQYLEGVHLRMGRS